jgi:hypothetical protein
MNYLKKISLAGTCLIMLNCTTNDAIENSLKPSEETNSISNAEKISNENWRVQTNGKTYNLKQTVSDRVAYKYEDPKKKIGIKKITLTVFKNDTVASGSNSKYRRTELRSTLANFSTSTPHSMNVTMNIVTTANKLVIGQIFSQDLNQGKGSDLGTIYLKKDDLYAQFDGGKEKLLKSKVSKKNLSFSIVTTKVKVKNKDIDKIIITGGGTSFELAKIVNNCYFKTGAYLVTDKSESGKVEITNLAQN